MNLLSTEKICEKLGIKYHKFRRFCKKYNIQPVEKIFKNKSYENFYDFNHFFEVYTHSNKNIVIIETYQIYKSKMN